MHMQMTGVCVCACLSSYTHAHVYALDSSHSLAHVTYSTLNLTFEIHLLTFIYTVHAHSNPPKMTQKAKNTRKNYPITPNLCQNTSGQGQWLHCATEVRLIHLA